MFFLYALGKSGSGGATMARFVGVRCQEAEVLYPET